MNRCSASGNAGRPSAHVIFAGFDTSALLKNLLGDEIANVTFYDYIAHVLQNTKRKIEHTLFNKLDDSEASTAHLVLNL